MIEQRKLPAEKHNGRHNYVINIWKPTTSSSGMSSKFFSSDAWCVMFSCSSILIMACLKVFIDRRTWMLCALLCSMSSWCRCSFSRCSASNLHQHNALVHVVVLDVVLVPLLVQPLQRVEPVSTQRTPAHTHHTYTRTLTHTRKMNRCHRAQQSIEQHTAQNDNYMYNVTTANQWHWTLF